MNNKNSDAFMKSITNFELNKMVTFSRLFSRIDLTLASRLILRCLIDFWNAEVGYVYPKQSTISKCTGLSGVSIIKSIEELRQKDLIKTKKMRNRLYYFFTLTLFTLLKDKPKQDLQERLSTFSYQDKAGLAHEQMNEKIKNDKLNINLLNLQETDEEISPYTDKDFAIEWLNNLPENLKSIPQFQITIKKVKDLWGLE